MRKPRHRRGWITFQRSQSWNMELLLCKLRPSKSTVPYSYQAMKNWIYTYIHVHTKIYIHIHTRALTYIHTHTYLLTTKPCLPYFFIITCCYSLQFLVISLPTLLQLLWPCSVETLGSFPPLWPGQLLVPLLETSTGSSHEWLVMISVSS